MIGKPAATILHLGPGLANGLANLHNARRARSPVLNIIGDHATWPRNADAPALRLEADEDAREGLVRVGGDPAVQPGVEVALQRSDLDGNSDWWLVSTGSGLQGYAPANYLQPVQAP